MARTDTDREPALTEAQERAIRAARRSAEHWEQQARRALLAALDAVNDGRYGSAADLALTAADWAKCAMIQRNAEEAETDGEA